MAPPALLLLLTLATEVPTLPAGAAAAAAGRLPNLSCDWTMEPRLPGNGNSGHNATPFQIRATLEGAPMAWRLGETHISREYDPAADPATPCDAQTLRFRGAVGGDTARPAAVIEVGNTTTRLGGSLVPAAWTVGELWAEQTSLVGTFTLPCTDGSQAHAVIIERQVSSALDSDGGGWAVWERRIELQRRCPRTWHHIMVNIAATAPVLRRHLKHDDNSDDGAVNLTTGSGWDASALGRQLRTPAGTRRTTPVERAYLPFKSPPPPYDDCETGQRFGVVCLV